VVDVIDLEEQRAVTFARDAVAGVGSGSGSDAPGLRLVLAKMGSLPRFGSSLTESEAFAYAGLREQAVSLDEK
jgi:hypothetical protein